MSALEPLRPRALLLAAKLGELTAIHTMRAKGFEEFLTNIIGALAFVRAFEDQLLEVIGHAGNASDKAFSAEVIEMAGSIAAELKKLHRAEMAKTKAAH